MEKLLVPAELEIKELLKKCPADGVKCFHKDKVYFICDSIYRGMEKLSSGGVHRKKIEQYYVPLDSRILIKILGGNCYKGILHWMEAAGIILPDCSWQVTKVCQGYRFTDSFFDSDFTWKTVRCKTILKKKVDDCIDKKLCFQPEIVNKLAAWFDVEKLRIDAPAAYKIIEARRNAEISAANGKVGKIRQAKLNAIFDQKKIENIEKGYFPITQDQFGYRIHTALTQLPKELRSLVTYEGKSLVEVDLSCSQLFFSCYLLDQNNWNTSGNKNNKQYTTELWNGITIPTTNTVYSSVYYNTTMCSNSVLKSISEKSLQNSEFLKKCCEGQLYESVVDKLDELKDFFPENYTYQDKRNKVKNLLLNQLFANPLDKDHAGLFCGANKPILEAFTALYPEVMVLFARIKEGHYKDLCKLLQRTESISMIGFVCKRLQKEYPLLPIYTLHDCLITTEGNEEIIKKVMQEEITSYIGHTPSMKTKSWTDYSEIIPEEYELPKAA